MREINRDRFFKGYIRVFGPIKSQETVDGLEELLGYLERDMAMMTDLRFAAYLLATVKIECAHKFKPIREYGRGKGKRYGKVHSVTFDGRKMAVVYYGRGYVQLTWRDNYYHAGEALGMGDALVSNPDLALEPAVAYRIASLGMRTGIFTTKKLSDYFTETKSDWTRARQIINGRDRDAEIGEIGKAFLEILTAATRADGATNGATAATSNAPLSGSCS